MGKRKDAAVAFATPPTEWASSVADAMVAAAPMLARRIGIRRILAFADGLPDLDAARSLAQNGLRLILAVRAEGMAATLRDEALDLLIVPSVRLSRMDQVRMASLFAFSQGLLRLGEKFIALVGLAGTWIDTLMVVGAGRGWEIVHTGDELLSEDIRPDVFQRVLHVAVSLSAQGREGKPVGVLLVLGDAEHVLAQADQMILNPFHGHEAAQRDIMDDALLETLREFAILDGAFLIRGDGRIESAGLYLRPAHAGEPLPPGLGARHASAAGITASADCLAITISESTGAIRLFRRGRIVTEIKRAAPLSTRT